MKIATQVSRAEGIYRPLGETRNSYLKPMKTFQLGTMTTAACLFWASLSQSVAIERLQISIQCTNVVLSWPSAAGETFIVQYRPTFDPSNSWQTLTSSLPAETGTNWTVFVHSNVVQHPNCGGSLASMAASVNKTGSLKVISDEPTEPMAVRANGLAPPIPLKLYPPGFDLSDYLIFDPASWEWFKGTLDLTSALNSKDIAGSQPQNANGSGDAGTPPETGFYRVVRNGVQLVGITNGMILSGTVSIPVEVGTAAGNLVVLSVREDGSPVGNSPVHAPFQGLLQVVLDTTAMSNGVHQISGFASWSSGGDEGSGDGVDSESPPITVTVYNEITFPTWIEHYGELYDTLLIAAQSAHTNADWHVDIYGSEAGYIGTFAGHTDDGNIYGVWNLVGPPPTFQIYTNERYFEFVVRTAYVDGLAQGQPPAAASSASAPKKTYRQTDNWTSKGMWVVANQQAWEGLVGSDLLDIASDGFAGMAEGFGLTVRPNAPAGESFRIGFGVTIPVATRTSQWASLRSALFHPESRNFFYLGHGSPNQLGAGPAANLLISASEISTNLHTIPAGQTNRHGYRFVFLFGCETASGTLPESFGIIHRQNVKLEDFQSAALTPGTFVGWNHQQSAGIVGAAIMTDNAFYIQHFQQEWLNGRGVSEALDRAKNNYTDVSFINRSKLKVFGNWELHPLNFNH